MKKKAKPVQITNNKRPPRMELSEEEVLKRMQEFSKRKEKFIAAVRRGNGRLVYP